MRGRVVSRIDPFGLEDVSGNYSEGFDSSGIDYLGLYDSLMSSPYSNYTIFQLMMGFWSSANSHLVGIYLSSSTWGTVDISEYCPEYLNSPEIQLFIEQAKLAMWIYIKQNNLDELSAGQSVTFSVHDQEYHNLISSIYAFGDGRDHFTVTATVTGLTGGNVNVSYFVYIYRKDAFADPLDIHQSWKFGEDSKSPIANLYVFKPYDFNIGCLCE